MTSVFGTAGPHPRPAWLSEIDPLAGRTRIEVNGEVFVVMVHHLDSTMTTDSVVFDAGLRRPTRKCDHCGRADWVQDLAYSWDEVVEKGWAIKESDARRMLEEARAAGA